MKKKILILIIILLIISPSFVYAKFVYGEYQEFIMNTDEYMEETDTLKREEVKFYNTYEIKKVDLGYKEECINCDTSNYISEILESGDEIKGGIKYQPILALSTKFSFFMLYDFDYKIKINELNIYDNDNKVDYYFENSYQEKYKYLNDGDIDTYVELENDDKLGIYLKGTFLAENLVIEIVGDELSSKIFILFNGGKMPVLKVLANNIYFVDEFNSNELKNKYGSIDYDFTDGAGKTFESLNPYYKKEIIKYHCYGEEKVILNNYVAVGSNLIYDDYITKYNYYIRTREEINDDIQEIKSEENLNSEQSENKTVATNQVKTKNKSNKVTSLINNNVEKNISEENDILQAEPLFNEVVSNDRENKVKFVIIVILLIITLQIIIFTLHRKK